MKQFKVKSSTLKKGFFCLFVPTMLFHTKLTAQPTGYSYGKAITIQGSQITGTLNNFPVLISFTDPAFRQAPTGRLRNANGYDVVFTLGNCSTVLPMQLEKYTASTGEYVAWVRLPKLVASNNLTICMYYGKTGVTTNPSDPAVWDANYMGVWHFNNNVSNGTSATWALTNTGTTNLTSSKIGEGRRLDNNPFVQSSSGSIKYLKLSDGMFSGVTNFTFEGWVYLETVNTNWERIFDFGRNTQFNMFLSPSTATNGIKRFAITTNNSGNEERLSSGSTTGTAAWHHFAVTIDAGSNTGVFYYDGAADVSGTITLTPSDLGTAANNTANYFGRSQYGTDEGLYGNFDEFRISNSTRSAGWIATSYRNQNSPSTFFSVGSELAATSLCTAVLPIKINSFKATPEANGSVTLSWTAEQELASDKYILERSANGTNWDIIKTIAATGNVGTQKYTTQDLNPIYPVSYYRLQQVESNNTITYTPTVSVKLEGDAINNFIVSPNPARQLIQLAFRDNIVPQQTQVELINNMGVKIPVQPVLNGNTISLNLPVLANGVYFLNVYIKDMKHTRKLLIAQ